jgi:tetratricopeptide (TPR) repeat protein
LKKETIHPIHLEKVKIPNVFMADSPDRSQRTSRRPVVTAPQQTQCPVKKLKQRDMDSACHRPSRVPQKFTAGRAIQNEKQDSYAVSYFKCNPDRKDTTPPERKLAAYEEGLNGNLSSSERFVLLVQQKAARYIVYGETSAEALRSHAAIGSYYRQNDRPESALRHLTRARQLEETNDIDPIESLRIAIDMSESYLAMKTDRKVQAVKNLSQANEAISRHELTEVADARLRYRRDLVIAHIASLRGNHNKAVAHYRRAWNALNESGGTENEEGAVLHAELADSLSIIGKHKTAAENYQRAHEIYTKIGMEEQARRLESRLPTGTEEDIGPPCADEPPPKEKQVVFEPEPTTFDVEPEPEPEPKRERELLPEREAQPAAEPEPENFDEVPEPNEEEKKEEERPIDEGKDVVDKVEEQQTKNIVATPAEEEHPDDEGK